MPVTRASLVYTRVYQNRGKPTRILVFCSVLFWSGAHLPETATVTTGSGRFLPELCQNIRESEVNQKLEPEDISRSEPSGSIRQRLTTRRHPPPISTLITIDTDSVNYRSIYQVDAHTSLKSAFKLQIWLNCFCLTSDGRNSGGHQNFPEFYQNSASKHPISVLFWSADSRFW